MIQLGKIGFVLFATMLIVLFVYILISSIVGTVIYIVVSWFSLFFKTPLLSLSTCLWAGLILTVSSAIIKTISKL